MTRGWVSRMTLMQVHVARKLGLGVSEFRSLELIRDADEVDPMTAGRLAELTGLTTGAVTAVVDRLEQAGFVTRERGTVDRRQVVLRVAKSREGELEAIREPMRLAFLRACANFSKTDLQVVRRFHETFRQSLEDLGPLASAAGHDVPAHNDRHVSAPREGEARVSLDLRSGASNVHFNQHGGADLYRAHFEGKAPRIEHSGQMLSLAWVESGFRLPGLRRKASHVSLHEDVEWSVRVAGGLTHSKAEWTRLSLRRIDIRGGVSNVSLDLPSPRGKLLVHIAGGAYALDIRRPQGAQVRVHIHRGASSLTLDDLSLGSVGGGTRWESPGAKASDDVIDIDVAGGADRFTLSTLS